MSCCILLSLSACKDLITSQWEFLSLAEEDGDSLVSVCLYMASEEYVSKLDVVQNKSNLLSLSVSVTL